MQVVFCPKQRKRLCFHVQRQLNLTSCLEFSKGTVLTAYQTMNLIVNATYCTDNRRMCVRLQCITCISYSISRRAVADS